MKQILKIAGYTIQDELHHKSIYLFSGIAILFVLMLRGCFKGDYIMDGREVDSVTIGWHVSIIAFQLIAYGCMLIAILVSMRLFKNDIENGMTQFLLSRPISRTTYVIGKIGGIWVLLTGFMFILHAIIYFIMLLNTGGRMPYYLFASLLSSLGILFSITVCLLLSLYTADILAALTTIIIGVISFGSDTFFQIMQNQFIQSAVQNKDALSSISLWRIFWPKIAGVVYYCSSLIKESPFIAMGPLHPVFNLSLYIAVVTILLMVVFRKQELR